MVNFWGTLLYINVMIMLGASENNIYMRFHVFTAVGMKTDVSEECIASIFMDEE